ncbi:hypothetical protein SAMN05443572_106374 [Myxococcus fulvus]|uniref:Uncharacterized protein n=1 Tax=Myxococcus fulvus TaxID=33 RepID=A0A511T223_MYXFU|nr:hypothetical protein [Myxococcus fulvus]GEN08201.1 hypothetical protein MFU01_32380 [Myxococcus fulvus]SEU22182.1 hypothetical protein SAMN05443572_106374 [Myxococcus fulvus]
MKVCTAMLRYHLGQVTLTYFVDHDEVPEDLGELDSYIETMRYGAQASGDLPWLLMGLRHLLHGPRVDLSAYGGGVFPLSDDDMRGIILRVLIRLDDRRAFSAPEVPVQLESMGGDLWRSYRDSWNFSP